MHGEQRLHRAMLTCLDFSVALAVAACVMNLDKDPRRPARPLVANGNWRVSGKSEAAHSSSL